MTLYGGCIRLIYRCVAESSDATTVSLESMQSDDRTWVTQGALVFRSAPTAVGRQLGC